MDLSRLISTGRSGFQVDDPALELLLSRPKNEYALAPRGINRVARSAKAKAAAREALALARRGKSVASFVIAALACDDLGRPAEAARWFGRAHALAPKEGWILLARADARRRSGDLDGFVADATAAHYLDEGAGVLRFAVVDPRRDTPANAIAGATRLLAKKPRAAWALALRADLKRFPEINDFAGALADFEAAAKLAPREAWIKAYLSRARISAGDAAGALEAVSAAARLRPDCGWIRAWKGEVLRRLGRLPESRRELDLAIKLDENYEFGYAWRGGTLRALGRHKAALKDLGVATALDPRYAWTFAERSLTYRGLGLFSEAFDDLEAARRLDPKSAWGPDVAALDAWLKRRPRDARALAWRGESRLRAGDAEGAARDLSAAAEIAPLSAWARTALGEAQAALGRHAAAVREFDAALKLEPGLAEASARRARARLDAGDARGALSDFRAAVKREGRASWIHAGHGEAALRLKRWDEAEEAFRQAAGLDRGDARARLGQARALLGAGRRRAAKAALAAVAERARALTSSGRHEDAAALADEIILLAPRDRAAWAARAEAMRCLGRYEEAVAAHDELVASGSVDARLSRGAARRAASDFEGALEDAESARSVSAYILKAEALRNLGREDEALTAAARACALDPRRPWAWTVRAKAARQAGRLKEALSFAERACRLDPRDAKAWAWLGDVLRALGRGTAARKVLRRAIELAPTVAWPRAVLAEVLREAGDARGAVKEWAELLRLDPRNSAAYDVLGVAPPSVSNDPGRAWAYAWRSAARRAAGDENGAAQDAARANALVPGLL